MSTPLSLYSVDAFCSGRDERENKKDLGDETRAKRESGSEGNL